VLSLVLAVVTAVAINAMSLSDKFMPLGNHREKVYAADVVTP